METRQSVNFFVCRDKYRKLKRMAFDLEIPASGLIREGIDLVIDKLEKRGVNNGKKKRR